MVDLRVMSVNFRFEHICIKIGKRYLKLLKTPVILRFRKTHVERLHYLAFSDIGIPNFAAFYDNSKTGL